MTNSVNSSYSFANAGNLLRSAGQKASKLGGRLVTFLKDLPAKIKEDRKAAISAIVVSNVAVFAFANGIVRKGCDRLTKDVDSKQLSAKKHFLNVIVVGGIALTSNLILSRLTQVALSRVVLAAITATHIVASYLLNRETKPAAVKDPVDPASPPAPVRENGVNPSSRSATPTPPADDEKKVGEGDDGEGDEVEGDDDEERSVNGSAASAAEAERQAALKVVPPAKAPAKVVTPQPTPTPAVDNNPPAAVNPPPAPTVVNPQPTPATEAEREVEADRLAQEEAAKEQQADAARRAALKGVPAKVVPPTKAPAKVVTPQPTPTPAVDNNPPAAVNPPPAPTVVNPQPTPAAVNPPPAPTQEEVKS